MANFPFFGSSQGAGKQPQFLSDMAAAEQEVEAYFARLAAQPKVEPEAVAAFELNDQQAIEAYNKWLNSLSMAPGDITKRSGPRRPEGNLHPVLGRQYDDLHELQGRARPQLQGAGTVQGRPGRLANPRSHQDALEPRDGRSDPLLRESDLICGKGELPPEHVTLLIPKNLSKQQQYVAAEHKAAVEPYSVDPKAAFNKARVLMDAEIKKLCMANIGGDQQKLASTQTRFVGVVHHVLLPCYQAATSTGTKHSTFSSTA